VVQELSTNKKENKNDEENFIYSFRYAAAYRGGSV
jgi:hypothetical protein